MAHELLIIVSTICVALAVTVEKPATDILPPFLPKPSGSLTNGFPTTTTAKPSISVLANQPFPAFKPITIPKPTKPSIFPSTVKHVVPSPSIDLIPPLVSKITPTTPKPTIFPTIKITPKPTTAFPFQQQRISIPFPESNIASQPNVKRALTSFPSINQAPRTPVLQIKPIFKAQPTKPTISVFQPAIFQSKPSPITSAVIRTSSDGNVKTVQQNKSQKNGSYQYSFQTNNGIQVQQKSDLRSVGGNRVEGQYSFTAPNGKVFTVSYYADETGYHPTIVEN